MPNPDLTPFLDARQTQLELVMAAGDAIESKALAVLASNIAILIFIGQSDFLKTTWPFIALILAFVTALVLTVIAIWPREYAGASVSMHQHPEYLNYTSDHLVRQLIADTEAAISRNKLVNKSRWIVCVLSLVITGVASLALGGLLYLT
jgi:hypothetical protein